MTRTATLHELIPAKCAHCASRAEGMCAVLSTLELQGLSSAARAQSAAPGEVLFSEAEPAVSYASLSSGVVKLLRTLADGRQQIVGLQFAPCLIGNFATPEASVTVEAVGEVSYCRIPRAALDERRAENVQIETHLMGEVIGQLEAARDTMLALGRLSARERVAGFILQMSKASREHRRVDLALTRTEIADYLGLTLETVSRQFSSLKRAGIIDLRRAREVVILDLSRLEAAADTSAI